MNVLETIYKRRSIREYSEEPITEDIIQQILTAGLLAPTSMNRKPCEFYVIQDKQMRIVGILALGIAEQQFPAYTDQDIDWNKVHRI